MKTFKHTAKLFFLLTIIAIIACQKKEDPKFELVKVDKTLQSYFDGITKFDYEAMRQACSPDYVLLEDGTMWTVEDHINFLKTFEGKSSISYKFIDVKENIDGSVAWRTHRNVADAIIEGKPAHFEWIESTMFQRLNGEWKIVILHSTTAKPTQK
jgi:hypothetical protein